MAEQVTLWAQDLEAVPLHRAPGQPSTATKQRDQRTQLKAHLKAQHKAARINRAEQAVIMREHGHQWEYIAQALGYANASGPYLLVRNELGIIPTPRT